MDNKRLIETIKEDFDILFKKNHAEVKSLVHAITRSLGRIRPEDKTTGIRIAKIIRDLTNAESSEEQFFRLNNPRLHKVRYSDSFFQSVSILKEDLFSILNKPGI